MLLARRRGARSARRTLSTASVTPVRWGFLVSTCAPTNEQRQYPFQEAGGDAARSSCATGRRLTVSRGPD